MSILEEKVLVVINPSNMNHYEKLDYEIPRYIDINKTLHVKKGTKILVKVEDLQDNSMVKVTKICDDCNKHITDQIYGNIIKAREKGDGKDRCFDCGKIKGAKTYKNNVPYEKSLEYYAKSNDKEYLLTEFSDRNIKKPNEISHGTDDKYWWKMPNSKSERYMRVSDRTSNKSNKIANKRFRIYRGTVDETNCLWATHPAVAKLLVDQEVGYKISYGCGNKEDFKCDKCGYILHNKRINVVVKHGISCPKCGDGLSYPEKFMFNILEQLDVHFETQKTFKWSNQKRYDFYIPSLNCIIETHGGQHYHRGFETLGGRSLEEEQENDRLKEQLAKDNKINNYIAIDCRKSELKYIKSSVLKSNLSQLFKLENIDWLKCHEFACDSLVRTTCDLWNSGIKNTLEIGNILKLNRQTIVVYLKQGTDLGWSNYDSKEESMKSNAINIRNIAIKNSKKVVQLSFNGDFINEFNSLSEASKITKIDSSGISSTLRGKSKTAGGFRWEYKDKYDKNNIKPIKHDSAKEVVQLTKEGKFINEFKSISEAGKATSVDRSNISSALNGKSKNSGGFIWMYKEDYYNNGFKLENYIRSYNEKPIIQLTKKGEFVKEWYSIAEANEQTGINRSSISGVINGRRNIAGGFKWISKQDYEAM